MKKNLALSRFAASGMALVASRYSDLVSANLAAIEPEMISATAEENFFDPENRMSSYRPYEVKDGMLVIPVKGTLLADFPYAMGQYATGYEYIKQALLRGLSDVMVTKIALLIDSPGGQVEDCFPLVDLIHVSAKVKPIRAFAKSAYSAAYAIASAANQIIVAPVTGGAGSIGVVTTHVDYSKALEKEGVKVTFIKFGKHKTDGNQYEPLSKDAHQRIQAEIDRMGEIFVSTVARNRGMDEAAVRATEALTYVAEEAVTVGLADSVGSLEDALVEFKAETQQTIKERISEMTTQKTTPAADSVETAAVNEQALATAKAQGKAEGESVGAEAERTRVSSILALEEAKGREGTATKLAMTPGMTADQAKEILASIAVVAPVAAKKDGALFTAAMDTGNPELGTEAEPKDENSAHAVADRIGANFKAAKGLPKK